MKRAAALCVLATLGFHYGCASGREADLKILTSTSATAIWEAGQKAVEDGHWEAARRYFRRIIDGFPQHETAPGARLALGDSYFLQGGDANYILAVAAYREFLTFYPSHEKAAYAQFQVGESYFRQRNPPDRDQTETQQALEEYYRLLQNYPGAEEIEAARDRIVICRQSLAESNFQVGRFYQRTRNACRAAVGRYEHVLAEYPDYDALDEVLFRISECLAPSQRWEEAMPYLEELIAAFPESRHTQEAELLLGELRERPPIAAPAQMPEPGADETPPEAQVSL